jgi:ribosomal protein S18 acetylase RimI-like enzyme
MGFQIEHATIDDIPSIQEITKDAFIEYMRLAGLTGTIAALEETYDDIKCDIENKTVLVAYIDNKVVGSVRVDILPDNSAYLSRFGVSPECQNMGIGKALIHLVDMKMKQQNVSQLRLHTASKAFPIIRFYYGRGFYIDSTSKDRGYIRALLCKDYT